ncbi:hypothetical protein NT6N_19230 [Oceaniferula spumae]|uniref:DoxX family protein n=1 Tax=Oceaniferula spumae TaxID=2979115 RepID=A0AAT9FLQ8_9BACT
MKPTDQSLSYTLARLGMGVNLAAHGLVRLPKLSEFSAWMVGLFEKSSLPTFLVKPYSYVLPIAELIVGILLILGLYTRQTLTIGSLMIISLIFGSCMIENWSAAGSQMIYLAYITALLAFREKYNNLSIDAKRS